jgi:hypothetical protein
MTTLNRIEARLYNETSNGNADKLTQRLLEAVCLDNAAHVSRAKSWNKFHLLSSAVAAFLAGGQTLDAEVLEVLASDDDEEGRDEYLDQHPDLRTIDRLLTEFVNSL